MKKLNLIQFAKEEVDSSMLNKIRGGEVHCACACKKTDKLDYATVSATNVTRVAAQEAQKVIKELNKGTSTNPNDSIPNDSIKVP